MSTVSKGGFPALMGLQDRPGNKPVIDDDMIEKIYRFMTTIVYNLGPVMGQKWLQDMFDCVFESQYRKDCLDMMKAFCAPQYLDVLTQIKVY